MLPGFVESSYFGRVLLLYWAGFLLGALNRTADRSLLGILALLTAVSLALLGSVAPELAVRQGLWLVVGGLAFAVCRPAWVRLAVRYGRWFFLAGVALLVCAALLGAPRGGARSWLMVGALSVQPVEWVKVGFICLGASVAASRGRDLRRDVLTHIALGVMVIALVAQRDLGPLVVLVLSTLFWVAAHHRPSLRQLSVGSTLLTAGALLLIGGFPHVSARIKGWLMPWLDPYGLGYQTLQARFALANGHLFGEGWSSSHLTYVPALATDLPLVGIVERVGFLGTAVVLILVALLFARIGAGTRYTSDPVAREFTRGTQILLGVQTMVSLLGAAGVLPVVGITFPFISYGGSAFTSNLFLLALHAGACHLARRREGPRSSEPMRRIVGRGYARWAILICVGLLPLGYRTLVAGPRVAAQPMFVGQRVVSDAEARAGIVSRNGETLTRVLSDGSRTAEPESLLHVVGYAHPRYGSSGLERSFENALRGNGKAPSLGRLNPESEPKWQVHTTIDVNLQRVVEEAMGDRPGAVVVLDPWSGEVLAMASSPRFTLSEIEQALQASRSQAPLFNRAAQGLYPPGSTFKLIVLASALETHRVRPTDQLLDRGMLTIDGYRISNAGGRELGWLTLTEALAYSSNPIFAQLAADLGAAPIRFQASAFGIGAGHGLEIPHQRGRLGPLDSSVHLASVGIGQGEVLVTPLEMAVVAAAVANGGYRVYPRLVTHLESEEGSRPTDHPLPTRAMGRSTAQVLADGMRMAVAEGTASAFGAPALIAGKTGTAENPHGAPHAWFVGFSPAHHPVVAMAVLVENGGSGGAATRSIAMRIAEYVAQSGGVGRGSGM